MNFTTSLLRSPIKRYRDSLRKAGPKVVWSPSLLYSAAFFAGTAIPATWDQGSASVLPSLPGFQEQFGISSGSSGSQLRNFISLIYIGYAVGAALSFPVNDWMGRRASFRIYSSIYIVGQLIAILAPNKAAMYASRIVVGIGIGSLANLGPLSIAEIAPPEMRGLLSAWFGIAMSLSLVVSTFMTYGIYLHLPPSRLQYQLVWIVPCVFIFLCCIASFFVCESPRWLELADRSEDALSTLVRLRRLPFDHERVQAEYQQIRSAVQEERVAFHGFRSVSGLGRLNSTVRELFTVSSNVRRLHICLVSYALAQLSGANTITSYFVPILNIAGIAEGNKAEGIMLSGFYAVAKLVFVTLASFVFIDLLGRRRSLFFGATLQGCTDIYMAVYLKVRQDTGVSASASETALAMLFLHAWGYIVGLFIMPYVFGAELWPTRIRSLGGAISGIFHWLFLYAMQVALPSLLDRTHNWGAFVFFASWCLVAILYTHFMIPEVSGLTMEEIEAVFKGSWFNANTVSKRPRTMSGISPKDEDNATGNERADSKSKTVASEGVV
ncbi:hypothetical protein M409DRAFT_36846 [Zasmidium cellare ATCC 36951]|uniref:Major facilitator superfamily (MFS) profile domain-containing protein n=1 Tax=Zasmidium cellare ATCC 36951 TaxID=1080233 RepID=A0A6A6CEU0_ZASCE|nr:uncharacterized protein M409DRAFT_36846 [Zasmidium cellare ATCC 36951]KAF2165581.1 hypothetical protein M409DRAFT_36846 [Zasmidium cellare ATCC 36951]